MSINAMALDTALFRNFQMCYSPTNHTKGHVCLNLADVLDSTKAMKEEAEDATAPTVESAVDAFAPTADAPGPVGEKSDESFVHWAYDKISQ
ncbi:hypothetical protein VNO78_30568 [Psophocarpus tetragonolobus]|uniref:Uncharacterized protein n=1 Tax=Psophocarpus tetragonolobus TaxID=3891 RepID=A0AAN9RWU8_PSOTE